MTTNYFNRFMTKDEFNKEAKASLEALKTVNLDFYTIQIQHNPLTNQVNIPRPVFGLALTIPSFMAFLVATLIQINPKEAYAAIKYSGDTKAKAKGKAWKETYKRLWAEFGCCYYYCKCFALSAFSEDYETDLCEVYELAQELADEASERTEARQKIQILKVEDRTQGFVF